MATVARSVRAERVLPAGTALGAVHLAVTDGEVARRFWTEVVGLTPLGGGGEAIRLGAGERELVVLHPGAEAPVPRGRTGLYHLAIHMPARVDLARAIARLAALGQPNAPTDHLVTETTYLWDPDGNGIELTFETPERGSLILLPGGMYAGRRPDGTLTSGRDPLDLDSLMRELAPDDPLDRPIPAGARIGHVHLHVADLERSLAFYRDAVGLVELMNAARIGMADASFDGRAVPHDLAINTWAGPGAPPAPAGAAGLRHYEILLPGADAVAALAGRLRAAGASVEEIAGGVRALDPSGNRIHLLGPVRAPAAVPASGTE